MFSVLTTTFQISDPHENIWAKNVCEPNIPIQKIPLERVIETRGFTMFFMKTIPLQKKPRDRAVVDMMRVER
jgi:hypothetical protein